MDIVSMALSSAQTNSELLGLATVAQQNNDAPTAEGTIPGVLTDRSVVTGVGLGLGSDTCTSTIIGGSVVSSSISGNCAPVILMMETDELRPSTSATSILTTTSKETQHKPILQNGETRNSMASLKVVESIRTGTSVAAKPAATAGSNLMNSIPVELSSSTSAASSILGSIASMIDPSAANITNTNIIPTNPENKTSTSTVKTNANINNTLLNLPISKTITNNSANNIIALPTSNPARIGTSSTLQRTISKEPRVPLSVPIQTKSAATITIKTPPGTSLTGPSGTMSAPLLQTILNNAEVQALMKRNPGQQITIIQVTDESLGNGNWGIQSSIKTAVSETLEAKKVIPVNSEANCTKLNYATAVARKRKRIEEPEEKAKTLKINRPVKKITRSGRVSRPPLYRIRDYKTILPTEEIQSGSSEDEYEDYDDQNDKDKSMFSDKPKNFKCTNCDKSYIGQASLDRHFRQNPTHGMPVGPSPEKKPAENLQSELTTIEDPSTGKQADQMSPEAVDLNSTETSFSPAIRLQNSVMRGRGRGMRKRRGRGRPPIYANHIDKPYNATGWSNMEKLPLDKRKQKAKELLNSFVDEDFLDVILPRLPNVLTPWEFMLMKTESEKSKTPNFQDIYNKYLALVDEVRKVAQSCLTHVPDATKENGTSSSPVKDAMSLSPVKDNSSLSPAKDGLSSSPERDSSSSPLVKDGSSLHLLKDGISASPVRDSSSSSVVKDGSSLPLVKAGTNEDGTTSSSVKDAICLSPVKDNSSLTPVKDCISASRIRDSSSSSPVKDKSSLPLVKDGSSLSPVKDGTYLSPVKNNSSLSPVEDASPSSSKRLQIDNAAIADCLGLTVGWYEVKDSLMPVSRHPPSIPLIKTQPQQNEEVVKEIELVESPSPPPNTQPAQKAKVDERKHEKKQIEMPNIKSMPNLTPLRNRPLNLKSVVTPGPIVEHPIPPGRPLPDLRPIKNNIDKQSMNSSPLTVPVSQTAVNSSPAILRENLTSNPGMTHLRKAIPPQEPNQIMVTLSSGNGNGMPESSRLAESGSLEEQVDNTQSPELPIADQAQLLQSVDSDVSGLQLVVPEVIQGVLPEVEDTSPIDIMPVGSTLMQLQDGTFLVQRPDGTTMQIQAPEGMTIETIQELLSVDGIMQVSDGDTTEMALESEDVAMVAGLGVNSADLGNQVAAT